MMTFPLTPDGIYGGYWGVFFLMVVENVIPPIPSEMIMGVAGIAAANGHLDFTMLVLAGTAGTVVGNLFWYEIGRRVGYRRLEPWVTRWSRWLTIEWDDVERMRRYFLRHGGKTVFVLRFLPMGRTMISLPAGLMAMPLVRFLVFTAAGSAVWNVMLVGAGYWLGTNFGAIDHMITPAVVVVVVVLVGWYLWRVLTWRSGQ